MRIEQLTFTRFIAATAIIIFHFGRDVFPFNYALLHSTVISLNIGVSYFFILSGFVITIAYSRKKKINTFQFYLLRFARIFPAFLISFLMMLCYLIYIGEKIAMDNFLTQLFLLHAWIKKHCLTLNFPSWSLSVEIFFYLVFPIVYNYYYQKNSVKKLTIVILFIWIISQMIFIYIQQSNSFDTDSKRLSYYFPLLHLNQFLSDNLLAYFLLRANQKKSNHSFFIFLAILTVFILINTGIPKFVFHNGFLVPLFGLLIYLISKDNSKLSSVFQLPFLILLGEISYGIYIYQLPVYKISNFILINIAKFQTGAWLFYLNFFLLLTISYFSFIYIEKPIIDKLKASFKSKKEMA